MAKSGKKYVTWMRQREYITCPKERDVSGWFCKGIGLGREEYIATAWQARKKNKCRTLPFARQTCYYSESVQTTTSLKIQKYKDNIAREKRECALRAEQQKSDNEYRAKQQISDNAYREKQQAADNAYRAKQQASDNAYRANQQAANNAYRTNQQTADNAARKQYIEACRQVGLEYAKNQPKTVVYRKNVILW